MKVHCGIVFSEEEWTLPPNKFEAVVEDKLAAAKLSILDKYYTPEKAEDEA